MNPLALYCRARDRFNKCIVLVSPLSTGKEERIKEAYLPKVSVYEPGKYSEEALYAATLVYCLLSSTKEIDDLHKDCTVKHMLGQRDPVLEKKLYEAVEASVSKYIIPLHPLSDAQERDIRIHTLELCLASNNLAECAYAAALLRSVGTIPTSAFRTGPYTCQVEDCYEVVEGYFDNPLTAPYCRVCPSHHTANWKVRRDSHRSVYSYNACVKQLDASGTRCFQENGTVTEYAMMLRESCNEQRKSSSS